MLLNACSTTTTNINPRPEDWAPAEKTALTSACPDISGVYEDWPDECGDSQCQLLNVLLFRTDYPLAERVEITQPSDETLKIIGKWPGAKTEMLLSQHSGDFECGPEGLVVTGGDGFVYAGWSVVGFANETRTFNRCSDGSLVMEAERKMHGNMHLYPINFFHTHEVVWVRWKAASTID